MRSGLLAVGALAAVLNSQTPPPDLLTGSWVNENNNTSRITQVVVRHDSGRMLVHIWGSCSPSDCDWGERATEQWNGIAAVDWDQGYATVQLQLIPQMDGRLLLVTRTKYRDGSGRTDSGATEFFVRENARMEGPEAAKAREILRRVADNYRNLPSSRLELTQTVQRKAGKGETRSVVRSIVHFSPPNRWRRESTGGREDEIEIADGKTRWEVYPQANEYRKTGQDPASRPFDYGLLDKGRSTPKIVGQERLDGEDCTIVRIDLGRGTTEDVWVNDATYLVKKAVTTDSETRRESLFSVAGVGEESVPDRFTFSPDATNAVNREQAARRAPETMVGKMAPDIALRDLAGREVRLRDLRGKVVLLDFWATWCGPCRQALPVIELFHRGLQGSGLVVYGVDDEPAAIAREFLEKGGYTLPSLVDAKGEATRAFRVGAWPTTVLIGRDGMVLFYVVGAEPDKLRDAIRGAGAW